MAIELVRTGTLIENKYREYFLTTLVMSGSASISAIVDNETVHHQTNSTHYMIMIQ